MQKSDVSKLLAKQKAHISLQRVFLEGTGKIIFSVATSLLCFCVIRSMSVGLAWYILMKELSNCAEDFWLLTDPVIPICIKFHAIRQDKALSTGLSRVENCFLCLLGGCLNEKVYFPLKTDGFFSLSHDNISKLSEFRVRGFSKLNTDCWLTVRHQMRGLDSPSWRCCLVESSSEQYYSNSISMCAEATMNRIYAYTT